MLGKNHKMDNSWITLIPETGVFTASELV